MYAQPLKFNHLVNGLVEAVAITRTGETCDEGWEVG